MAFAGSILEFENSPPGMWLTVLHQTQQSREVPQLRSLTASLLGQKGCLRSVKFQAMAAAKNSRCRLPHQYVGDLTSREYARSGLHVRGQNCNVKGIVRCCRIGCAICRVRNWRAEDLQVRIDRSRRRDFQGHEDILLSNRISTLEEARYQGTQLNMNVRAS